MKPLIVLAVAVGILSSTGCCWPMHEGRYRHHRDSYSEMQRPPPPGRAYGDRGDRGDYRR